MKKNLIVLLSLICLVPLDARDMLRRPANPSKRNILATSRFRWDNGVLSVNAETAKADTIRMLGIMAEFKSDNDDKTTGDGRFDLGPASSDTSRGLPPEAESAIDPPPHDRTYFLAQLGALSNYYKTVSKGRLTVIGDVFETVIVLPDSMRHYHSGLTQAEEERGLAELARDAVMAADELGAPISDHQAVIVFHAGVGGDIDLGYDYTDGDIPSGFVDRLQLEQTLGLPSGIPLGNGQFVPEIMILPETENQEGIEMGLLGTEALMFGFQLGLPALWDTQTGQSGIGRWGLMDQGSGNYMGLIPAWPCAFSRYWLGWDDPVDVQKGDSLSIGFPGALGVPAMYRVPISQNEYYLIENRQHDPNQDGAARGRDVNGIEVVFRPDSIETALSGVIVSVDDYDFGLPGSGILIWHVDENLVAERLNGGVLNPWKGVRAVDLEEADGAQDIGQSYGMMAGGSGSENGVLEDAWFEDNEINLMVNHTDRVRFSSGTYPSSTANSGAWSDVEISGFSKSDTIMSFSVTHSRLVQGFPQKVTGTVYPALVGNLDGLEGLEIVAASRQGDLFAWNASGGPLVPPTPSTRVDVRGDTIRYDLARFASAGSEFPVSPVLADLDADGKDEIVAVTSSGKLLVWHGMNPTPEINQTLDGTPTALAAIPLGSGRAIVVGMESGRLTVFNSQGVIQWSQQLADPIAGFCDLGLGDALAVASGSTLYLVTSTNINPVFSHDQILGPPSAMRNNIQYWVSISDGISLFVVDMHDGSISKASLGSGQSAWADLDNDGQPEIACGIGGRVVSLNYNGSLSDNYPVPTQRNAMVSTPVIGDVDGDETPEIIVSNSDGEIEAWKVDGTMAGGFPLSIGGKSTIPPVLTDLDQDRLLDLVMVNENEVSVWKLSVPFSYRHSPWAHPRQNPDGSAYTEIPLTPSVPTDDWMPSHSVYNYPNPAEGNETFIRYQLYGPAEVHIDIYDLAGNRVASFSGPGDSNTDNEIAWNLNGVSSGVYLCKVHAKSGSRSKTVTIKIAVAK